MSENNLGIHQPANNLGKYHNRTFCSTLQDMRDNLERFEVALVTLVVDEPTQCALLNPVYLLRSLLEEVQVYGNRMEAHLEDNQEFNNKKEEYKKLVEEIKKLKEEKNELTKT